MGSIGCISRLAFVLCGVVGSTLVVPPPCGAQAHARRIKERGAHRRVARASWYGQAFSGLRTASGAVFDPYKLTAAHRTLDLGTEVKVTELRTGRSVVVQITDRGPYEPGREIDLSYAAARKLGIVRQGVALVRMEPVTREPVPPRVPVTTASLWPPLPWLPRSIVE